MLCTCMRLTSIVSLVSLVFVAAAAQAQTCELHAVGVGQTGPNDQCGAQLWALAGVSAGPESRGTFLGREDPSPTATDALPLTSQDCALETNPDQILLVSTYDAAYGVLRGWSAPDSRLLNRPLRGIPVPAGNGVYAPIPLPGTLPPNPQPPTIPYPATAISLGSWMAAAGDLQIVCDDATGHASIAGRMTGLVAHGVYTVWGHWADAFGVESSAPFGGEPNAIVADKWGGAEYCREVLYCPLDLAPDGSELQFVSLLYQADSSLYGAVPFDTNDKVFVGIGGPPF